MVRSHGVGGNNPAKITSGPELIWEISIAADD